MKNRDPQRKQRNETKVGTVRVFVIYKTLLSQKLLSAQSYHGMCKLSLAGVCRI